MKTFVFGYGSLINLESASKALKRNVLINEVIIANLKNYQRDWLLWDNVYSLLINKEVKGAYLNISYKVSKYANGILIEISDGELENLKIREKNYDCVDVTDLIEPVNYSLISDFKVYAFVGKTSYLLDGKDDNCFIFENYIEIVNKGLLSISNDFYEEFHKTTLRSHLPILGGMYSFIDPGQQQVV